MIGSFFILMSQEKLESPDDVRSYLYAEKLGGLLVEEYKQKDSLEEASRSVLERTEIPTEVRLEVLNEEGIVLFDNFGLREGEKVDVMEMAQLFVLSKENEPLEERMNYHIVPLIIEGKEIGLFILSYPVTIILEPLYRNMVVTFLIALFSALVVFLLLALFLSQWLLRPLQEMVTATEKIAGGDYESRLTIQSGDELGRLATAFNEMTEKLYQSRKREKELEQLRRDLVANVSHDLRTPLASIRGYVEGLLDGMADDAEKRKRYLQVIYDKALILQRLIHDLFELSRLERGILAMEKVKVPASEMLQELAEKYSHDAELVGITFQVEIEPHLPTLFVDPIRVEQVLTNLLQNAFRHASAVTLRATLEEQKIKISVEDNGEGIASSQLPYIFDRFYSGEKSRSRQRNGTGLGLAISKEIVSAHDGTIWAESEVGKGSTFSFFLPVYR
ncbi:sensor histidine kinase [Heliorestis convoluta]|uniref:histidine kinase n=1 Tax=Heliorestis convoluta TaxID=356322 RepID=A0A5Q2MZC0_9FIRM|nr:ATP-binding protein [Heliorestis convoluta]QGG48027.1 two-component sensor histidine kinase [Heliorestis convoluta]